MELKTFFCNHYVYKVFCEFVYVPTAKHFHVFAINGKQIFEDVYPFCLLQLMNNWLAIFILITNTKQEKKSGLCTLRQSMKTPNPIDILSVMTSLKLVANGEYVYK